MVLPGHLGGGYLVTKLLLGLFPPAIHTINIKMLLVIGTLAGEIPDIDLLYHYLTQKFFKSKTENHRDFITHAPFFWLIVSLIVFLTGLLLDNTFITYLGPVIFAGSWSHFIFDSIEFGVRWLWPISNKRYKIFSEMPKFTQTAKPGSMLQHWQFVKQAYFHTWTFWAELFISITALIVFFTS